MIVPDKPMALVRAVLPDTLDADPGGPIAPQEQPAGSPAVASSPVMLAPTPAALGTAVSRRPTRAGHRLGEARLRDPPMTRRVADGVRTLKWLELSGMG